MSKFIDRLNQLSQAEPPPMGFGRAHTAPPKAKMLLIASLAKASADKLPEYAVGADAGLLHISNASSGTKAIGEICQAMPDIPWGGWVKDSGLSEAKPLSEAGSDFLVFPAAGLTLSAVQGDEAGKIIELEPSLSDGMLRAVNELPADAVLIASDRDKGHSLTWYDLMMCQHFASLITKPLLVTVLPTASSDELKALWEAGISGVVIEIDTGQTANRLEGLRQVIDELSFPPRRQHKKPAVIPHIAGAVDSPPADVEDDEDGEDDD